MKVQENQDRPHRCIEYRYTMAMALVVGLLGGLGAVLFRHLIRLVQHVAYQGAEHSLDLFDLLDPWYVLLLPAAGGLVIAPIVCWFARETKGHGVPEVMEAVAVKQGVIRKRIVAAKTLASAVCIGTGGSVGREGPIVQIGSAIGSTVGQLLKVSRTRMRTLVGCGAAAGIAATFNAPVAGVLFALEIILGDFGVRRFTPIVVSSVVATAVSHHFMGNAAAFSIGAKYMMVSPFELATHSVLGLAAGLAAVVFIYAVYRSEDLFEKLHFPCIFKPALGGLLLGGIGLAFPHVFGVGYETIERVLNEEFAWDLLILLLAAKMAATSITLGSGGSGGIFAPSLLLGAVLGGLLGHGFHKLLPDLTAGPGAYSLVGMGAMVSAATHAPLTSIMIVFEMTGDYKIILPLMFACIIGNAVSSRLNPESIYTEKLARRGLNLHRGQEVNVLASLRVQDVLSDRYLAIRGDTRLGTLLHHMVEKPHLHFYVTDEDGTFHGVVDVEDLRQVVLDGDLLGSLVIARDLVNDEVPRVRKEDTLDKVMLLFGGRRREELPVVEDGKQGDRLIGVMTRQALISAYNDEILKRDAVHEVLLGMGAANGAHAVHLGRNLAIAEVEAPGWMAGKTLAELDLRKKHGIQVLLIHPARERTPEEPSPGDQPQVTPKPDYTIHLGDDLVILGTPEAIQKIESHP